VEPAKEHRVQIEFTDEAKVALYADCFKGKFEEALEGLGPTLLNRADSFGRTHATIAGREIRLRVVILNGNKAIIEKGRE
jgi:hypothetical protein